MNSRTTFHVTNLSYLSSTESKDNERHLVYKETQIIIISSDHIVNYSKYNVGNTKREFC